MYTRRSPIEEMLAELDVPGFSHPAELVKLGVKGRELVPWAEENRIEIPTKMYETLQVGEGGVLARVGGDEVILECSPGAALHAQFEKALGQPRRAIFRVVQQSATYELAGLRAKDVLAQTCAIDFRAAERNRIMFTRIAGVSCGIIPLQRNEGMAYRIWVDYTFAQYLGETLANIISELGATKA
jgi:heterotetrameric sarcosine oxidase gamma subunit